MIDRMHVFTYGSLMFPEVWAIVVGREFETVRGAITGYANYRVQGEPYPGIVATPGSLVAGLVYLDVDAASLTRLDRFEGDFYDRLNLAVRCDDGVERTADAYVVPAANREGMTSELWTAESFVASGGLADFLQKYQGFSWLGEEA
jgi:gamma-glutamylcyclotransferase (GGCT)/AIG2-like uncharacterized protein YtfP